MNKRLVMNNQLKLEELRNICDQKNGKCLSTEYFGSQKKLLFKCQIEEHPPWQATPAAVKHENSWCPKCAIEHRANKSKDKSFLDLSNLVITRGGKLLSKRDVYEGLRSKVVIECILGHQWTTNGNTITKGSWCPQCSSGLFERICKVTFEKFFKTSFRKCKFHWLVNKDNNLMELDGYSEEHHIAFEYNGEQHYKYYEKFHSGKYTLEKRQEDDLWKRNKCIEQGIKLFIVPAFNFKVDNKILKIPDLPKYIANQCELLGIPVPENVNIDISDAYLPEELEKFLDLKKLAESKNGKFLSDFYMGSQAKHHFYCNIHHYEWWATPNTVIGKNHWCILCGGSAKNNIQFLQDAAAKHGGKCLATDYTNNETKVPWKCKVKEHPIFWAVPYSITRKNNASWCPACGRASKGEKTRLRLKGKPFGNGWKK